MGNFSWFQMTHPITHGFCTCRPGWKKVGMTVRTAAIAVVLKEYF